MSYAPIDEAWEGSDFPPTYAVYSGLRPELNRPEPEATSPNVPCGFDQADILPSSVPSLLSSGDTFSETPKSREPGTETGWMYNMYNPVPMVTRRRRNSPSSHSPHSDEDSDYESLVTPMTTIPATRRRYRRRALVPECNETISHLRDCQRCKSLYFQTPTGYFWWLDGRDAFIMIGGLILLTLVGILIKRS